MNTIQNKPPVYKWPRVVSAILPLLISVFFIFLLLKPLSAQSPAASDQNSQSSLPNTMLIIDGSGSMWGKITDGHKILIARKAIASSIRSYEDKLNLGLSSYGHRKRGSCQDIQLLKSPGPLNALAFSKLVNRIKPLGKTPITTAITQANKTLSEISTAENKGGSIILLTDGPENCYKDPCAQINQKFAKDNNLTVHVVAFSMTEKDAASLQCLASNTGGKYYTPQNAEQLETALSGALAASLRTTKTPAKPPVVAVKKQRVKPELRLSAHMGEDTPPIDTGVNWIIEKLLDDAEKDPDLPPWKSAQPTPKFDLEPGKYRITADLAEYQITRTISLAKSQEAAEKFIFNLSELILPAGWSDPDARSGFGKLLFEAQNQTDTPSTENQSPKDQSEQTPKISVIHLKPVAQKQMIPSGGYKIVGIENGKMLTWFIHARPGKTVTIPIWKNTGRIRFKLKDATTNNPLTIPYTRIYYINQQTKSLTEVARSTAITPQFDLSAGSYVARVENGLASTFHNFTIMSGKENREIINLEHAAISIQVNKNQSSPDATLEILELIDKKAAEYKAEIFDFSKNIYLNPGKYRFIYRSAPTARAVIKEITVKSGELTALRFSGKQAEISFVISNRQDALSRHQVFWQLRDKSGNVLWQSTEPEPTVLLSAGKYKIQAEIGDEKYQAPITIKGIKQRKFDLSKNQIN